MKKIIYIVLFLLCVPAAFTKAQDLTNAQERYMKMDILYLMEDYSLYSNLVLEEDKEDFINLFSDTTIQIYNDLLGISSAQTLSVTEYADKLLEAGGGSSTISTMNISHEDPYYINGLWFMDVTFNKRLYYMVDCNLQFSSEEYYNADHQLTAQISWNPEDRICKIEQLRGTIESEVEPLPEKFWVLKLSNENDTLLLYNNKRISFDSFGQSFIPKEEFVAENHKKNETPLTIAVKRFQYPSDSDIQLLLNYEDEACNMLNMSYIPKRWRFKLYTDIALDQFYKIESEYKNAEYSSSAQEYGFVFGYVFPTAKKNKWSFYFGASLRESELDFGIPRISYLYRTKDMDNDEYYRAYFIDNMIYSMKRTEVGVPLYFDWEGKINSRFSIYMDFGVKAYMSIAGPQTSFSAKYTTKGLYPKYDNLVLHSGSFSESGTINGFVTDKTISSSGLEDKKRFNGLDDVFNSLSPNVDALTGIGFRVRILNNTFFELGCRYQYNFYSHLQCNGSVNVNEINYNTKLESFKFNNNMISKESNVPIKYVMNQSKLGGKEVIANITDSFTKMNSSALYINAGIVIRY